MKTAKRFARFADIAYYQFDEATGEKYAALALAAYGRPNSERELRDDLGRNVAHFYYGE
jgi:hypothetical protein